MKIVVFGATGKTGELTWRRALEQGLDVTVFGRSVEKRYPNEPVRKVQGDVLDKKAVALAVDGQDAVLVCLGPISLKDRITLSEGTRNIADAMKSSGVNRVFQPASPLLNGKP